MPLLFPWFRFFDVSEQPRNQSRESIMPSSFQPIATSMLALYGNSRHAFVAPPARQPALNSRHPVTPRQAMATGYGSRPMHPAVYYAMMSALRASSGDAIPPKRIDVARLDALGNIGCINEPAEKVTRETMNLLALYTGSNVAFATQEAPPNIFADFPKEITNIVHTRSTGALGACDTVIFPDCSEAKIISDAPQLKSGGRVIVSERDFDSVIEKLALLHAIRPDLELYGHAPDRGDDDSASLPPAPVAASYAVANIQAGERAFVVRPLTERDAAWLTEFFGVAIEAGAAIAANFNKEGTIDRAEFEDMFTAEPVVMRDQIAQAAALNQRMVRDMFGVIDIARFATAAKDQTGRTARVPGKLVDRQTDREQIQTLGPTVVYGASGNIGKSMSKALIANGVPLCGIVRKPNPEVLSEFAKLAESDAIVSSTVPETFVPSTAFLTASAGWPKDADGKIIFDRSRLLGDNVKILAPIFKTLSPQTERAVVISNPCSEMTYLGWLLRPDLADKIFAHAGTDVTRQRNRAPFPDDAFTVGPHSPAQVNVKRNRKGGVEIDPRISSLGQLHQERSRDGNSVTVPTATAAIWEAISIATNTPHSLALPVTADEAGKLTAFMTQCGQPIDVSEGIAITLPRDQQHQIRWSMLTEAAEAIPEFSEKCKNAIGAMEDGRSALLQAVVDTINSARPTAEAVDQQWVLDNRGAVLSDALEAAQQKPR
jgi:hypothetical protein